MNMVKGEKKNGIAERIPELMCTIIYTVMHSENIYWDFPGGPGAKIPCFQCRGPRSDPRSGNSVAQMVWHSGLLRRWSKEDSMLPLQGAWVRFLVGELRSHMPHGASKNKQTKKKRQYDIGTNRQAANWIDYNPEVEAHAYCYCFMTVIILQYSKERWPIQNLVLGQFADHIKNKWTLNTDSQDIQKFIPKRL